VTKRRWYHSVTSQWRHRCGACRLRMLTACDDQTWPVCVAVVHCRWEAESPSRDSLQTPPTRTRHHCTLIHNHSLIYSFIIIIIIINAIISSSSSNSTRRIQHTLSGDRESVKVFTWLQSVLPLYRNKLPKRRDFSSHLSKSVSVLLRPSRW